LIDDTDSTIVGVLGLSSGIGVFGSEVRGGE
jgi:hypothetical protein